MQYPQRRVMRTKRLFRLRNLPSSRGALLDRSQASLYNAGTFDPKYLGIGAQVAQLVEQATENRCVGGSIPPLGTIKLKKPFASIR